MVVGVVSSGGDLGSSPAVPGLTTTQSGPWGIIGTRVTGALTHIQVL